MLEVVNPLTFLDAMEADPEEFQPGDAMEPIAPDVKVLQELNRKRVNLWREITGNPVFFEGASSLRYPWACVSDPNMGPAGENPFRFDVPAPSSPGQFRAEISLLYPDSGADRSLLTTLSFFTFEQRFAPLEFFKARVKLVDQPDATRTLLSTIAGPCAFTIGYTPGDPNTVVDGQIIPAPVNDPVLSGEFSDQLVLQAKGRIAGNIVRFIFVNKNGATFPANFDKLIDLRCAYPGKTLTSVERAQGFEFRSLATKTSALTQQGGDLVRVIGPKSQPWKRIRAAQFTYELISPNGSVNRQPQVVKHDCFDSVNGERNWRFRTSPTGLADYDSLVGVHDIWKRARRNAGDVTENSEHRMAGNARYTAAPLVRVRGPHARSISNLWTDAARENANWPDWQTIDITVPAALSGGQGNWNYTPFTALELGFNPAGVYVNDFYASHYRIPLGVTPEREVFIRWDAAVADPVQARKHEFVNLTEFHDARLTDETGQTFWLRDALVLHAEDNSQKVRRYGYWRIVNVGPNQFDLHLYANVKSLTPVLVNGAVVNTFIEFQPSSPDVTPQEYRTQTHEGTWPDSTAPWRFFGSPLGLSGPVAEWTIGRQMSTVFAPGQRLKLHLPKSVVRQSSVQHMMQKQLGWDANINFQSVSLPALAPTQNLQFIDRKTEVYDVETRRVPRKFVWIAFRNGQASLGGYRKVIDLRLFTITQADIKQGFVTNIGRHMGYSYEQEPAFRDLAVYIGAGNLSRELNAADWSFDRATGALTLLKADSIGAEDEFMNVIASFESRDSLPEIEVTYGNVVDGSLPLVFNPYRKQIIGQGDMTARETGGPFYSDHVAKKGEIEATAVMTHKWMFDKIWPVTYQRTLGPVGVKLNSFAHTFRVPPHALGSRDVDGVLAYVNGGQDFTMRYRVGWRMVSYQGYNPVQAPLFVPSGGVIVGNELRWGQAAWGAQRQFALTYFLTDGTALTPVSAGATYTLQNGPDAVPAGTNVKAQFDEYAVTETDFLGGGSQLVPPRNQLPDSVSLYQRMIYFQYVSSRQNFQVRSVVTEMIGRSPQCKIQGVPFAFHANETTRLERAWAANRPA